MAEKEASGAELAKLYQGGATLAKTAAETGLGRFAVAYRLRKAGTERRNRGSPRKTDAEKGDFARQQLEAVFGKSLSAVTENLVTGEVTIKTLAVEKGIRSSTLATQLRRAGIEVPNKGGKHRKGKSQPPAEKPATQISIFNLVDIDNVGDKMTASILDRFANLCLDPTKVAAGNNEDLRELGFTEREIIYMRKQLRKNGH